ncbi:hypothetical protein ACFQJ7_13130 [Halovenus rubra]|uniref:Uncharacterized protein n=2 Tax=Halovenus rubra TaxID=869890 RepID=A0ACC7E1I4_9EURY|nr:hypothetical protein [Halovenus rubra]
MTGGLASFSSLSVALLAFLAGMVVPTRYGMERLAGFGRWFASKQPYKPQPGKDEKEAMQEAVEQDGPK